jgi:hypothetical protein
VSVLSLDYIICPHCTLEVRRGHKACHGCHAAIGYGPPWPWMAIALLPSIWVAVTAHRFFYDSVLVSIVLGGILFGGLWAILSMVFEHRAVFKSRSS